MPTWDIKKEIGFDYGHRVWSQKLNLEFSLDDACVCRHLHGHRGKVFIHLSGDELTRGMVTDFKHLNVVKKFFDDYVDHKFIIDKADPLLLHILNEYSVEDKWVPVYVPETEFLAGYTLDLTDLKKGTPEYEYYEGFFVVDFLPTSENLSKWTCDWVQAKMDRINVNVSKIEWWETPKSCSTYSK